MLQAYKLYTQEGITYGIRESEITKMCLSFLDIYNYGKGKTLYAWHIKQLEIFDTPKQLSDFIVGLNYLGDTIPPTYKKLTKAPQRIVWVYTKELKK